MFQIEIKGKCRKKILKTYLITINGITEEDGDYLVTLHPKIVNIVVIITINY